MEIIKYDITAKLFICRKANVIYKLTRTQLLERGVSQRPIMIAMRAAYGPRTV